MDTISFTALGTQWNVSVDGKVFDTATEETLRGFVNQFEKRFSRFLEGSEVNQWREAVKGKYAVSKDLRNMLERAEALRLLTNGRFDPAIGMLLEATGYNAKYRLIPDEESIQKALPRWSLTDDILSIDGPIVFDLGGIGKGYCIDRTAEYLRELGFDHFIVEAGGDMYGTTKSDGSAYRVAIEYPGQPDLVVGVVELRDQAIAVSDSFRRRWGKWHHIIDPKKKSPAKTIIGCAALASNAFDADSATSALFLSDPDSYPEIRTFLHTEYLTIKEDTTFTKSEAWSGELFL